MIVISETVVTLAILPNNIFLGGRGFLSCFLVWGSLAYVRLFSSLVFRSQKEEATISLSLTFKIKKTLSNIHLILMLFVKDMLLFIDLHFLS